MDVDNTSRQRRRQTDTMQRTARPDKLAAVPPAPVLPIQLCNNTTDDGVTDTSTSIQRSSGTAGNGHNSSSWCVNCSVTDPLIVEGDNMGKYTLWNVRFKLAKGGHITVKKRYSDFESLHQVLARRYGKQVVVNALPPKNSLFEDRFSGEFLERRRSGLEYWLNSVVLDPLLGYSGEVRRFVLLNPNAADGSPGRPSGGAYIMS